MVRIHWYDSYSPREAMIEGGLSCRTSNLTKWVPELSQDHQMTNWLDGL